MEEIECPYCGYKHEERSFVDTYELYELGEDDEREVKCEVCRRAFFVMPEITREYQSRRIEDEDYYQTNRRKVAHLLDEE